MTQLLTATLKTKNLSLINNLSPDRKKSSNADLGKQFTTRMGKRYKQMLQQWRHKDKNVYENMLSIINYYKNTN